MSEYPDVKMEAPKPETITTDIGEVLVQRKTTHGSFIDHAYITQMLKNVLDQYWENNPNKRMNTPWIVHEALDMIFHKIGRVVAGRWDFKDHWVDIQGYAKLIEKDL